MDLNLTKTALLARFKVSFADALEIGTAEIKDDSFLAYFAAVSKHADHRRYLCCTYPGLYDLVPDAPLLKAIPGWYFEYLYAKGAEMPDASIL